MNRPKQSEVNQPIDLAASQVQEVSQEYHKPTDEEFNAEVERLRVKYSNSQILRKFEAACPDDRYEYYIEVDNLRGEDSPVSKRLQQGWTIASDYEIGGEQGLKRARMRAEYGSHDLVFMKRPKILAEEDRKRQAVLASEQLKAAQSNTGGTINNTIDVFTSRIPINR